MLRACILISQLAATAALAPTSIARRKLGSSDLEVSDVCLGTMTWGKQNTLEEGVEQPGAVWPLPRRAASIELFA
mgnify:CR=1 FL=1